MDTGGEHSAAVAQFVAVANCSEQQALFFLESHGFDQEAAIAAFFDEGPSAAPAAQPAAAAAAAATAPAPAAAASSSSQRITSMAQMRREDAMDSADANEYYTGGEKSGLAVQAPPKGKEGVSRMFDDFRKQGAVSHDDDAGAGAASAAAAAPVFTGTGYTLGDDKTPSQAVPAASSGAAAAAAAPSRGRQGEELKVTITMWRDGFTVQAEGDEEPPVLRTGGPDDAAFMEDLRNGHVPKEFMRYGRPIAVALVDQHDSEYVPPKKTLKSFSGAGYKLGSPTPNVVSSSAAAAAPAASSSSSASATAAAPVEVDDSQPTTRLQIRLADGTRLVGRFNHTHTIADVRAFVNAARTSSPRYVLMTTFPNKALTDETQTLADAKLLNTALVQKPC